MLPCGKLSGIPSAEYHAAEAISHSRLELFRRRPIKYYKRYISKTTAEKSSRVFDLGRAAHDFILEGQEAFVARNAVWRGGNKTKAKKEWELFQSENAGKNIITTEDETNIKTAATALFFHPEASVLLANGEPEITWRVNSKSLPIPLQCRTDWLNREGNHLTDGRPYALDLKTTASLDEGDFASFQKSFENYGYHRQAGFYNALLRDLGIELANFFFLAIELEEPFGIDLYRVTQSALNQGLTETLDDLERLARCYATDTWPNRPQGIQEISCSQYYLKKQGVLQLT